MMKSVELTSLIEPVVTGLGYDMWGVEYLPQGKHSLLRVYIDSEDGITLDDCTLVSRQLSAVLDVEEPIKGHYTLEVSSPGMERPLFTIEQFERFVGETVSVRMRVPVDGRRKFSGELTAVSEHEIVIQQDDQTITLTAANIDKANLVFNP